MMTPGDDLTGHNRATYDRIAEGYLASRLQHSGGRDKWWGPFENAFLDAVPADGLVADLGCGPGVDTTRFAGTGRRVAGLDLSSGMLRAADSALSGRLLQADLRFLPIRSESVDGIWCSAALLHIPHADTERVLAECHRVLRPSGWLALVTAVGQGSRLEEVPYAAGERRWFVYRSGASLGSEVASAGFRCQSQTRFRGNRDWLAMLARRDSG